MSRTARIVLLLALVATTVGCDRVTKHMAMAFLVGTPVQSFFADTVRLEYDGIFNVADVAILLGICIFMVPLRRPNKEYF